jgi:hypothetical protein
VLLLSEKVDLWVWRLTSPDACWVGGDRQSFMYPHASDYHVAMPSYGHETENHRGYIYVSDSVFSCSIYRCLYFAALSWRISGSMVL